MPWIEINELEYSNLCKVIQRAIDEANDPAPYLMMLCNLLIKIKASVLPDRDLDSAVIEIACSIRNQAALHPDASQVTWDCALTSARNIIAGLELYGRKP